MLGAVALKKWLGAFSEFRWIGRHTVRLARERVRIVSLEYILVNAVAVVC